MMFYHCLKFLLFACTLISCNDAARKEEAQEADSATSSTEQRDTAAITNIPETMDPYIMGGEALTKITDTLGVKMYVFTLKPGDSAAMHSHPDHLVYVIQGGKLEVSFQGQGSQVMDFKPGDGFVSGPVSDAVKNTGKTTIKLLVADIHRPRN